MSIFARTMAFNNIFPQHSPMVQVMTLSCQRMGIISLLLLCLHPLSEISSFPLLSHSASISRPPILTRNPNPVLGVRPSRCDVTLSAFPPSLSDSAEWRQYVPLVVSVAVIFDILLGSPFANAVTSRLRPSSEVDDKTGERRSDDRERFSKQQRLSKERIDSQKVAQEAIQKAQFTLELRSMLEAQRDPVKELQRRTEEQTALLQQNQAQLQAKLNDELKRDE